MLQRAAPALTDRLLDAGGLIWRMQRDTRPDDVHDTLDAPLDGAGAVHGGYRGRVARTSAYTAAVGQRPWVTRALVAGSAVVAYRRLRRCP